MERAEEMKGWQMYSQNQEMKEKGRVENNRIQGIKTEKQPKTGKP